MGEPKMHTDKVFSDSNVAHALGERATDAVVFLHGTGDDGSDREWAENLGINASIPIVSPNYSDLLSRKPALWPHLLHGAQTDTTPELEHEEQYHSNQLHLRKSLLAAQPELGQRRPKRKLERLPAPVDTFLEFLLLQVAYRQIHRFNKNPRLRAAIRGRIMNSLDSGATNITIVGHSFGAVVALDLLQHLRKGMHVNLLVTASGALSRRRVGKSISGVKRNFPYDRVGGWVNIFNTGDVITKGKPIGGEFPQTIDVGLSGKFGDHDVASCFTNREIVAVLREILHTQELVPA
jgi:pimeloyl-ACP methyl ester carboxylesterase